MERGRRRAVIYENTLLRLHTHSYSENTKRLRGNEEATCWALQAFISSCPPEPLQQRLQPLLRQLSASLPAAPGRLCTPQQTDWTDANIAYQAKAEQHFPTSIIRLKVWPWLRMGPLWRNIYRIFARTQKAAQRLYRRHHHCDHHHSQTHSAWLHFKTD